MVRKANIIKHLNMMGYSVDEDNGIITVSLKTCSGMVVLYSISEEELIYGEYIVEKIVSKMNELIVKGL